MKREIKECDIVDREHEGVIETITLAVIFDYDQEDGRSPCDPYFDSETIEICDSCKKYMLKNRRYIYAYGAMGHNKYYLMNE